MSLLGVAVVTAGAYGGLRVENDEERPVAAGRPPAPPPTGAPDTAPPSAVTEVGPGYTLVAEARVPSVPVFDVPGAPAPRLAMSHPNEEGAPRVFLVKEAEGDWLRVLLPVRPNGSTGWIRLPDVSLARNRFRIRIELAAHRLTAWDGERVIADEVVGVGTKDTPTPGGEYYITELLQPPSPNGPYGPFAFGLSGFSDVLKNYAGGNGVIGLHGTNDPAGLGKNVSAGCIRMRNEAIVALTKVIPLGTPVEIVA